MSAEADYYEPVRWRGRWGWRLDVTAAALFLALVVFCHEFLPWDSYSDNYLGDTSFFVLAAAVASWPHCTWWELPPNTAHGFPAQARARDRVQIVVYSYENGIGR